MILGVIRPVDVTWSAGERSPGAPFGASLTDRGLRLASWRPSFQQAPASRRKPGHRERQCPQRVSGALPIRREHPEMVGESIVQGLLIASIILCTFGSVVSVYAETHRGKSSPRPIERNEQHRRAREAR